MSVFSVFFFIYIGQGYNNLTTESMETKQKLVGSTFDSITNSFDIIEQTVQCCSLILCTGTMQWSSGKYSFSFCRVIKVSWKVDTFFFFFSVSSLGSKNFQLFTSKISLLVSNAQTIVISWNSIAVHSFN